MTAPAAEASIRFESPAGKWVLAAMVMGSAMASLDATVVSLALPQIGKDFNADLASLQWVVTGYTLTLASFILLGGSLGDRFGRRRVFLIGVVWFVVASCLCALAPSTPALVVARLLQGVGGALLTPGSLAIISAVFHPDDRGRAIGAWSGFGGVATAIGPFLGGWLVEAASWRWIFLLNVPLGGAVVWVTTRHVPETIDPNATPRFDLAGATWCALGLAGATYGLIEQQWSVAIAGVLGLVLFVIIEWRSRHPMLPLSMFRNRPFSATNGLTFIVYGALGGALFLLAITLQQGLGYSPIGAGAALFPITLIMLVFSARSGALAQRVGARPLLTLGPIIIGIGLALMTRVEPGQPYVTTVLPALLVFAAGLALTVAPLTATVLGAAAVEHAGLASAINNAVARVASLLAVAAVPIIAGVDPSMPISPSALVAGFHQASLVAAAACAAGGVFAWFALGERQVVPPPVKVLRPTFHCQLDATPLATEVELSQ